MININIEPIGQIYESTSIALLMDRNFLNFLSVCDTLMSTLEAQNHLNTFVGIDEIGNYQNLLTSRN